MPLPDRKGTRRGAPFCVPGALPGKQHAVGSSAALSNQRQLTKLPNVPSQRKATGEDFHRKLRAFVEELKTMPVAVQTEAANEQHYEVGWLSSLLLQAPHDLRHARNASVPASAAADQLFPQVPRQTLEVFELPVAFPRIQP